MVPFMRLAWHGSLLLLLACGTDAPIASVSSDAGGDVMGPIMPNPDAAVNLPDAERDAALEAAPEPLCKNRLGTAGRFERTITAGGRARTYVLRVPAQYTKDAESPLVLMFHGYTESGADAERYTHFNTVSDARGYIMVYPDGVDESWNAVACCGTARSENIDDVGLIRSILDDLEATYCVDKKRIFAAGFSNGGFLVHRLACELSDRIAAFGVHSGEDGTTTCLPRRHVPIAQIHGNADTVVPMIGNFALGFRSTDETMNAWAMRNGCADTWRDTFTNGPVSCKTREGCRNTSEVTLCTRNFGTHIWFGDPVYDPGGTFDSSVYLADFFDRHPLTP